MAHEYRSTYERERERFKRKEIGGRGSIVVGGSGGEHTGYVDLLLFRIFHGFLGSTSLSLYVCVSKRATAYVCVCLKVYISVVCECFLDLSKILFGFIGLRMFIPRGSMFLN